MITKSTCMLTSRYFLRPQSLEGQIWFQEDRKTCDIEVSQELKMSNGTKTCHKWSILLLFSFLFAHFELTKCSEQKLLVLSMDGFRYDYYDFYAHLMPNLKFLGTNGVLAKNGVKSTFQTVTFPTHFTIATGLNEETHGLVANSFYDRKRNESFTRNGHKKYFYQGEPIWVTAKKSGKKTAVLLWVGNSADWSPYHPDVNVPFDPRISFETRIVTALEHLNNDIDFAMVYVDEPDSIQHDYGTFSSNLSDTMVSLDKLLGKIVSNATQGRLKDKLNVIVLADHGMLNVTARKQIDLNIVSNRTLEAVARFGDALTKEQVMKMLRSFRYEKGDTVTHFYATSNLSSAISQANLFRKAMTDSNITRIIEEMKKLKLKNPSFESPMKLENLTYYLRHQLPDRWFYKNNDRIGDLVVVTDAGTIHNVIGINSTATLPPSQANHGFDNELKEMRPIFIGYGPGFKKNYSILDPFPQNCIYSLMCQLLQVKPAPNNGSLEPFKDALTSNSSRSFLSYYLVSWLILICLFSHLKLGGS